MTVQFRKLISRHIGLNIPDGDESTLSALLTARSKALNFPSVVEYCNFLDVNHPNAEQEWKYLAHHLTVGESYFFRDTGQMALLEREILPTLLEKNAGKRSLRLLSAGCSTGEEPYSLAILIDRLVPAWQAWDIRIFGIDVNEEALNIARKGVYTDWSFRGVPAEIKARYFHQQGTDWVLDENIRNRVTFCLLNLVKDPFPSEFNEIKNMDLILCRNVSIYFSTETVTRLVDKFVNTLNPNGYLLTGHAELQGIVHPLLDTKSYPESVVYLRNVTKSPSVVSTRQMLKPLIADVPTVASKGLLPPPSVAVPKSLAPEKPVAELHSLETLFRQGHYQEVIAKTKQITTRDPHHFDAWQLMTRAHANLGQHKEAEICCEYLLKIDAFSAYAYYLKAHIAMDRGDESETKTLLKKTLYLDPNFIAPHLELAEIYAREGDAKKARKMRVAACDLLRALPSGASVKMIDSGTADTLLREVERLL